MWYQKILAKSFLHENNLLQEFLISDLQIIVN